MISTLSMHIYIYIYIIYILNIPSKYFNLTFNAGFLKKNVLQGRTWTLYMENFYCQMEEGN